MLASTIKTMISPAKILVLLLMVNFAICWDSDQLEVFDVVDEVKGNFYELLNITKDAITKEVRSAFKRLSLVLHPDKNLEEDTSEKFRNLVSVYEVLRDDNKRKYYDDVLVNGLPNWKSAMFYFRRVRKIGLLEGTLIVFFILTISQYLVAWAAYLEAKYNEGQMQGTKKPKRNAPVVPPFEIPKPSVFNTLPFQIPKLLFSAVISTPQLVIEAKDIIKERVEDALAAKEESEEEEIVPVEPKVRKRKQGFKIPEGPNFEVTPTIVSNGTSEEPVAAPLVSGGFWTDEDLNDLVQLVKKHPGGTNRRWEVIAESIGRSVSEVTFMANKLKNNPLKFSEEEVNSVEDEQKVKQKTKGGKLGAVQNAEGEQGSWNQHQQRALEDALTKYPKGCLERWERIADYVPDKTKEECMIRYKHLVEVVKKNKAQ